MSEECGQPPECIRIALLFFGQPRYLDNPAPYAKHKKFFLDKDFYDVDVYCHTWWGEDTSEYDYSSWSKIKSCPVDKNAIDKIETMYSPAKLIHEPPRKFAFKDDTQALIDELVKNFKGRSGASLSEFNHHWNKNNSNYSNILSQLYSIEQVCKLCQNSKEEYDFIVLSRLDNNIMEFPQDLRELDTDKFYISDLHSRFPDMVYFFGQKFLPSHYFYSKIDYIVKKYQWDFWEPSNEAFKYFSVKDFVDNHFNGSPWIPTRIRVGAVRDMTGLG